MPKSRGSNAAKKGKTTTGNSHSPASTMVRGSFQADIVGVALSILAIAMLVSLVAPSSAVVTSTVSRGLTSLFGVGAVLAPISLFFFSLTFFIEGEDPLSTRIAIGLGLVTLAILSFISLFVPGAEADPSLVLSGDVVGRAGGYIGGGLAWGLLTLVGLPVGCVILAGLAVLGFIVCGFSMSTFMARLAAHMRENANRIQESRSLMHRKVAERTGDSYGEASWEDGSLSGEGYGDDSGTATTSFIGSRTTTVLTRAKRRKKSEGADASLGMSRIEGLEDDEASKTPPTLRRKAERPPRANKAKAKPTKRTAETHVAEQSGSIPEFLLQAQPSRVQDAPRSSSSNARQRKPTGAAKNTRAKSSTPSGVDAQRRVAPNKAVKPCKADAISVPRPGEGDEGYELPPLSMLSSNPNSAGAASSQEELQDTMDRLQGTLHEFGLSSRVVDYVAGPIVTTFRVEMGEGERVSRIRNLEDDIALTLAAEKVRIFAPIPGTSFVGIEIPNKTRQNVHLGDVLPTATGGPLEVAIGRDSSGRPVVADIAKMPHMLVAGTTGSGKSVMINSMIMSLLMRTTPKQVRLIMIDPKRVEFSCYNGLPHLYVPVVTEPRQAASALQWAVSEMERRLRVFERAGAREIKVYNTMCISGKLSEMEHPPEPMPYLVVIIDELSDLMMVAGKDVEASIVRIAQLARAAGIHLVIATQRPSANVVTGLIKSNIDNRVALKVSSGIDSRVILDETGAERLLGNGDMLFKYRGLNMQRVLGCYTSDAEINEVVDFIRDQAEPDYHEEILSAVVPSQPGGGASRGSEDDGDDPLVWEAAQIVVETRLGSTSGLQRRLKVGYARAGRIMDMLEAKGVVGPPDGSKPREVLIDEDGLEELKALDAKYREVA